MNISIKHIVALSVLFAGAFAQTVTAAPSGQKQWTVVGCDRMDVAFLRGDTPLFILQNSVTGAEWRGARLTEFASARDGQTRVYEQKGVGFYANWFDKHPVAGRFDLRYELAAKGESAVVARYTFVPEFATTFGIPGKKGEKTISAGPHLIPTPYFKGGKAVAKLADGTTEEIPLPPAAGSRTGLVELALRTAAGEETRLAFDPPALLHMDHGELRVRLAGSTEAGKPFTATMTITPPAPAAFEPGNRLADVASWFPLDFNAADDFTSPSALGMESWLERPAGKRGWLQMKGKDFRFEDGTPAKFWGINICWSLVTSENEVAEKWADRCAKYGVNYVRFHKFINHMKSGTLMEDPHDSTKLNEEKAVKFDYFSAALAKRGVYYGWSQYYAYTLSPADKDRVLAYDELMAKGQQWFKGTTIMLVAFAPDLQDLHIKTLLNLVNRKNTVTGKRYAEDRALAYIEIQNEDDIFFPGLDNQVKQCPTYYKLMKRQFSDWLQKKYGTAEAWQKAWAGKMKPDENWADGTVDPFGEYIYDMNKLTPRVLDVYAYLYDAQTNYYRKVKKALRDAGYGGEIVGSCWQTATFLGHLYNMRSDREVGFIDRHNYGGGNMLVRPGGGLLSAGLQQVGDRPYNFSEWGGGGVFGGMESVPVIGFIGMGVQGWDASAQFASNEAGIARKRPGGASCDRFLTLAQYPAIARALYRGDLIESAPVAVRTVSRQGMDQGAVGFTEQFSLLGGANIKEFAAAVPQEALAVGPVMLDFADGPVDKPVIDRSAEFIDTKNRIVRSASGQVRWDYSGRGYFTVDTPGTQAVIGYAAGADHRLKDVVIRPQTPLAFIYVSAADRKATLADARSILVTALARVTAKGDVLDDVTQKEISWPIDASKLAEYENWSHVIEPVVATVELKRKGDWRVVALDHGGRKTEPAVEIPVEKTADGIRFVLDGHKYRTMFYLLEPR